MKTARAVLVIGSVNRDYICRLASIPRVGETVLARELTTGGGGKGGNQAIACARFGAPTSLVACVGADADGRASLAGLAAAGVNTDEVVVRDDARTGTAFVMVADDGDNCIVVVPGANALLDADLTHAAIARRLRADDVLVVSAEIPLDTVHAVIREAHGAGARVVLNLAPHGAVSADLLQVCDPLVVNAVEANALLGNPPGTPMDDAQEIAIMLAAHSRSAVVTLGSHGAFVAYGGTVEHVEAEHVPVVDSTGAGDAFTGALAAALCQGMSLLDAVRRGVSAGSHAVSKAGAQGDQPLAGRTRRTACD